MFKTEKILKIVFHCQKLALTKGVTLYSISLEIYVEKRRNPPSISVWIKEVYAHSRKRISYAEIVVENNQIFMMNGEFDILN